MNYLYYPGCSLKSTGIAYEESLLAVVKTLGISMEELDDWNCCGATAYMAVDELKAYALASRNLALAEKTLTNGSENAEVISPCAACYLVLFKAQKFLKEQGEKGDRIKAALKEGNLSYTGRVNIRHPLDVFVNDVGLDKIKESTKKPLKDLKVASYYGCQILRPYDEFDDAHNPRTMDQIVDAMGGTPVDWPLKTRCCGASLTGTVEEVGMRLSYILLKEAKKHGADVMVTACPLCQFNLECYQDKMQAAYKEDIKLPVVYFTQLMGLAFGLPETQLGMQRLFVPFNSPVAAS